MSSLLALTIFAGAASSGICSILCQFEICCPEMRASENVSSTCCSKTGEAGYQNHKGCCEWMGQDRPDAALKSLFILKEPPVAVSTEQPLEVQSLAVERLFQAWPDARTAPEGPERWPRNARAPPVPV